MGAFKSFLQNTGHVLYQHKDDILFFGGMAVSTVGTIVACKKSMDYKDILIDDSKEQKEKVVIKYQTLVKEVIKRGEIKQDENSNFSIVSF